MSRWNPQPPEVRFWKFVQKRNSCWLWTGSKDTKGYGLFCLEGKVRIRKYIKAHRFIYQHLYGHIPKNLDVHHACNNPSCVNPKHLTALDRLAHAKHGKWANLTHCPQGHPYDEENTYHNPSKHTAHRVCRECMRVCRRRWKERNA